MGNHDGVSARCRFDKIAAGGVNTIVKCGKTFTAFRHEVRLCSPLVPDFTGYVTERKSVINSVVDLDPTLIGFDISPSKE